MLGEKIDLYGCPFQSSVIQQGEFIPFGIHAAGEHYMCRGVYGVPFMCIYLVFLSFPAHLW